MQLVQHSDAARLSGLTPHQLREWCGRRGVVIPDVPAAGRGRHALYSWQTVVCLRVLNELKSRFAVEVGCWSEAIAESQLLLRGRPFPALWGMALAFMGTGEVELLGTQARPSGAPFVVVPLDPHLSALATELSISEVAQLPLFAAVQVRP